MYISKLRGVLLATFFALICRIGVAQTNVINSDPDQSHAHHHIIRSKAFSAPTQTPTTHEVFVPFFLNGDNFVPTLNIQNLRKDVAITVNPVVLLPESEMPLQSVTIGAHDIAQVDLGSVLALRKQATGIGALMLRYRFPSSNAISAFVQSVDEVHNLYINSPSSPTESIVGNVLEAALWSPDKDSTGFVAILNTTSEPRKISPAFVEDGVSRALSPFVIGPHRFRTMKIDDLLVKSRVVGAGISLKVDNESGGILALGSISNSRTGFSKRIQFINTAAHFHDQTLRSGFVVLGNQPNSQGFPLGIEFRAIAVVRNTSTASAHVNPIIRYRSGSSMSSANLPVISLGPLQTAIVDLGEAQRQKLLPADLHTGTLDLTYDGNNNGVIAELFNFSKNGNYEIGTTFSGHPGHGNSSIWKTDEGYKTAVTIENTAGTDDVVELTFYHGSGVGYTMKIPVPAATTLNLDVNSVQQTALPDANGNPFVGGFGTFHANGANGNRSRVLVSNLIYSANDSDYVGFPASPCDGELDDFIGLDEFGDGSEFDSSENISWSDGSQTQQPAFPSSISNPGLASSSGSVVSVNTAAPTDSVAEIEYDTEELFENCSFVEVIIPVYLSLKTTFGKNTLGSQVIANARFCGMTPACSNNVTPGCGNPSYTQVETPASVQCPQYGRESFIKFSDAPGGPGTCLGIAFPATGPGPCDQ